MFLESKLNNIIACIYFMLGDALLLSSEIKLPDCVSVYIYIYNILYEYKRFYPNMIESK